MFGRAAVHGEEAGAVSAINRRNTKVRSANETFCQRVAAAAGIRSDKIAMMLIGPDGTEHYLRFNAGTDTLALRIASGSRLLLAIASR